MYRMPFWYELSTSIARTGQQTYDKNVTASVYTTHMVERKKQSLENGKLYFSNETVLTRIYAISSDLQTQLKNDPNEYMWLIAKI